MSALSACTMVCPVGSRAPALSRCLWPLHERVGRLLAGTWKVWRASASTSAGAASRGDGLGSSDCTSHARVDGLVGHDDADSIDFRSRVVCDAGSIESLRWRNVFYCRLVGAACT